MATSDTPCAMLVDAMLAIHAVIVDRFADLHPHYTAPSYVWVRHDETAEHLESVRNALQDLRHLLNSQERYRKAGIG